MIKNVKDLRDEFFDNDKLSAQSIKDLIWHIENDVDPRAAISLVTDARLMNLVPLVAKHLDNEDDFIRQLTVGCVVGRLAIAEYAEKALNMAQADPEDGPRVIAISSLGAVINKTAPELKKQIAHYLYNVVTNSEYDDSCKRCAFNSVLEAMNLSVLQRRAIAYDENYGLVKLFKIKHGI